MPLTNGGVSRANLGGNEKKCASNKDKASIKARKVGGKKRMTDQGIIGSTWVGGTTSA